MLVRMVILLVRNLFVLSRYLHFKRSKSLKKPENFKRLIFQNFSNFRQTEYIFFEKKLGLAFQRVRICQTHCVEDIFSCHKSLSVDSRCLRTPGSNKKNSFWNLPRPDFEKIYILCFQLSFPLDPDKNYKRTFAQGSLRTAEGLGNSPVCYSGLLNFPLLFSTFYTYGLERKQNVKLIFQNSKPVSTDRFATRPRGTLMVEYLHSSRRYATVMLATGM